MSRTSLAYLAIILTTVLWASSLIFAKLIFAEVGPIVFVALRYTLAVPFLLVITLQHKKKQTVEDVKKNWKLLLVAGLSGPFISQILQYIGLELSTASDAILLLNLTPIFAVILAAPVLNEKITFEKTVGLVLATIGAILIVMNITPENSTFDILRFLGAIIVIVSTFFFAINGIVGKIAIKSIDAVSLTFYSTLIAVPFIWISATLLDDVTVLFTMSMQSWLIMMWVAVVNTVIAFILYYESMKHIEASLVQIMLNLIAVWGILLSIFILNETVTFLQIFGGTITVIGVIVAQMAQARRKSNEDHL
ncbi:MAG: DMT family transporter [Candidatus Thorarchaeota archaeon]|nr:MAG: DMT family transporter [Candidatus Thorarchaeota archaeon]